MWELVVQPISGVMLGIEFDWDGDEGYKWAIMLDLLIFRIGVYKIE